MKSTLNVIFTIDESFVQHFAVTLFSLLENNQDLNLNIYVIHSIVGTENLQRVIQFANEKYKVTFQLITIDATLFEDFKTDQHYSKAVYFRLLFTEILPHDMEKALFLDADTVVTGSLEELAEYEFDNEQLLAVKDMDQDDHKKRLGKLGFRVQKYFNAGVLLINLKGWRNIGAARHLINLANEYMEKIEWWDQDILNMYFYDSWQNMDSKFNALHLSQEREVLPTIVHFAGPLKPWLFMYGPPYKWLYWQYIKLTPYADAGYPDLTSKNIIIKINRKIKALIEKYLPFYTKDKPSDIKILESKKKLSN